MTERSLTREARPTPRSDSLRGGLDTSVFSQRFAGIDLYTLRNAAASEDAPASQTAASARAGAALVQALAAPPPPSRSLAPAPQTAPAFAEDDGHTAIYDIVAHTIYLPNGDKLEAHSGIGHRLDDPRYVAAKNRGPTPPNVYGLTLREHRFHGVRALRLTPVGDGRMFGRDGILAHSYMLGPGGQSNGCVAVRNYQALLHAFLDGSVDRMVVVDHLTPRDRRIASIE